ncbi:MAG: peptide deformylase [Clostridiales bacterium]|jgi:peptide deformylase|nr:peptide deformylase [Clostridiales bacterium]
MALRYLRYAGDEILRKKSKPVKKITQNEITLLDDMIETMRDKCGVGLAAVQVGALKRMVIVEVDANEGVTEMINPELIKQLGSQRSYEGCLSVPGYKGEVIRPRYVEVKALNRNGEEIIVTGEGLKAIAICHELDHMDGELYTDKAENMHKLEPEDLQEEA